MKRRTIAIVTIFLLLLPAMLFAQQKPPSRLKVPTNNRLQATTSNTVEASTTATLKPTLPSTQATVRLTTSSLSVSKTDSAAVTVNRSKSGIDTIIVFQAQDSMRYFVRDRHLRLRGNASVKNRAQTLQAEVIDVFFDKGYMQASTARDSLGRVYGVPKFTDGKESYYGATLSYNFRTQRGTISLAETKMGEGFFFGERVKRVGEDTFYMQDGCYTTCDKTHPHFFFKSSRMKVIAKDKIFADFLTFYIEDVPLLAVPFGVFMELGGETGRRSGVIIPQVFVSSPLGSTSGRGIAFDNFGYYFAINDNLDAKVTASFFTKGGIVGRVQGNYVFGRRLRGSVEGSYGYVAFSPTEAFTEQWNFALNHNQELTPFTSIGGNLNFSSPGYNRATQIDLMRRVQQTLNSSFSLNHRFDNGLSLNAGYRRVQNLGTNEITQSANTSVNVPQFYPFKNLAPRDSWVSDIFFSYSVNTTADFLQPADSLPGETAVESLRRRTTAEPFRARIQHSPSINISPKFGYFTVSPNISYRENWYFRRIAERTLTGATTGTLYTDRMEQGFFREYVPEFRLDISTKLFGIANPRILGVNSLRHTLIPSVGFSYVPDVSRPELGMVGRVMSSTETLTLRPTKDNSGREITYSRFERDNGGVPIGLTTALTWSLTNNFDAKIAESDTSDKVVQLLALNASGSVNFAAKEFQWSPIGVSFSNTLGGVVQFSGGATFDVYGQSIDSVTTPGSRFYKRVDEFLINRKDSTRGLARLTNAGFTLSYAVGSSGGVPAGVQMQTQGDTTRRSAQSSEDAALGARFQQRMDNTYDRVDLFGDQTPGSRPLDVSWNSSYNAAFSYSPEATPGGAATLSALIAAQFSLTLEKSWRLATGFSYDVVSGVFNAPSFQLNKDLHCWEMSLTWNPIGPSQSFIFRIGMKAAQLRDIQYTRRESPLFRQ